MTTTIIETAEQKDALIQELATALRACQFELISLSPRLTPTFRKGIQGSLDITETALGKVPKP